MSQDAPSSYTINVRIPHGSPFANAARKVQLMSTLKNKFGDHIIGFEDDFGVNPIYQGGFRVTIQDIRVSKVQIEFQKVGLRTTQVVRNW